MNNSFDLRQYITLGLKWWWLVAISILVAAATGYVINVIQPPVYKAFTTIMIGQPITQNRENFDITSSEQLAQTYADMAKRQPVLQGVVDTLKLADTWQTLELRVQARPVPGTQLLEITVEASSPEEAQLTANEIARQLLQLSPTERQNRERVENQQYVRQRLEKLQAKIEAGEVRSQELEEALDGPLSVEQAEKLQNELDKVQSLIAEWEATYSQLVTYMDSENSLNSLTIIEPAQADPHPLQRQTGRTTLIAGLIGLALVVGLIFLLESLDDTLKSIDDLKQVLNLTPLGAISTIGGRNYPDKLVTVQEPFSPASEAYRMIRSSMQFISVDQPTKSILITSPTPGDGKSTTAANLAVVMAQAGLKTILVDADLRRPTQHEIFQLADPHHPLLGGLTDLLTSPQGVIENHLRKTKVDNLYVITSGVLPPNPAELMGSQRMKQLVARLSELADMVILDSPPAAVVTDAVVLSTRVDGVVLVSEAGKTKLGAARQAVSNLQQAGAHLLGGILNRASAKTSGSYYYYHTSYSPSPNGRQQKATHSIREEKPSQRRLGWLPFVK